MTDSSVSSPVRVLHVLSELRSSGAEVMLRCAGDRWEEHGIAADILALAPRVGPYAEELRAAGYRILHQKDNPPARLLRDFRSLVRTERYDVVHIHCERANFWLGVAARSAGAAVVQTLHSVFEFHNTLRAERMIQRRLAARSKAWAHVAVSPSVAANEQRRFGIRPQVIENWCDHVFVPPTAEERARARAAFGLPEGATVVVSVGNCAPVKRHETVLQAMAHPSCPSGLVHLHVGEEDEGRRERRIAERLGIADRVRFLGRTHPLPALHAADVFVMPSAREGAGVAAIEALAVGLPCVVADVPGLRDLADASPSVTLTSTEPEQLLRALARAKGATSPIRVGERFDVARGVAQYATVCHRVAAARHVR